MVNNERIEIVNQNSDKLVHDRTKIGDGVDDENSILSKIFVNIFITKDSFYSIVHIVIVHIQVNFIFEKNSRI